MANFAIWFLLLLQAERSASVCTLVVPNLRNFAFLLRTFRVTGAEGGIAAINPFSLLLRLFRFLRKFTGFLLGTVGTVRTMRLWLYLSCS